VPFHDERPGRQAINAIRNAVLCWKTRTSGCLNRSRQDACSLSKLGNYHQCSLLGSTLKANKRQSGTFSLKKMFLSAMRLGVVELCLGFCSSFFIDDLGILISSALLQMGGCHIHSGQGLRIAPSVEYVNAAYQLGLLSNMIYCYSLFRFIIFTKSHRGAGVLALPPIQNSC